MSGAAFWLFQVPNLVLAAAMYTLIGRFLLSLVFPPDSDRVIWRVFVQATDPVVKTVGLVTPRIVPPRLLVLLAAVWCFAARVALFFVLGATGALT